MTSRRLLAAIFTLSSFCFGTVTLANHAQSASGTTCSTCSFTVPSTTVNNGAIMVIRQANTISVAPSDGTHTATACGNNPNTSNANFKTWCYVFTNLSGSVTSITWTNTNSTFGFVLAWLEFNSSNESGSNNWTHDKDALGGSASSSQCTSGTPCVTAALVLTGANGEAVGAGCESTTAGTPSWTPNNSFISPDTLGTVQISDLYKIDATGTGNTETPSGFWSTASNSTGWACMASSIAEPAPSGATGVRHKSTSSLFQTPVMQALMEPFRIAIERAAWLERYGL